VVQSVRRHLRVKHPHTKLQQAKKRTPLFAGDWIQTSSKDGAAITFCDGGTLYLNQQSELIFQSANQEQEKYGEVAESVSQQSTHTLQTSTATATSTGSLFEVKSRRGSSTVVVEQGTVEVQNKQGRVSLQANQQTIVPSGKAPEPPTKVDASKTLTWTAPLSWQVLTAAKLLSRPRRIVIDNQGFIYVTDAGTSRVVKLTSGGQFVAAWGAQGSGPGQFGEPWGIALGNGGNIFVTDAGYNRVEKFTLDGQFVTQYGKTGTDPGQFDGPHGIRIDPAGNMYVADSALNRIQKLSPAGQSLGVWAASGPDFPPGSGPGQFDLPQDVAFDATGNVYIADYGNNRAQKLSPTGAALAQWSLTGTSAQQFDGPTALALDAQGNLYVAGSGTGRIQELSPSGKVINSWGTPGSDAGQFVDPEGVALDPQGNIYVADTGNGRIQKLPRAP
jgi:sugar lactone lactonase YvrE